MSNDLERILADPAQAVGQLLENEPRTIAEIRQIMDSLAPALNGDPPPVGAYHEAVRISDFASVDVAVPDKQGPLPVVLYIHGGAWVAGAPSHYRKLACRFAEAGFLLVSLDYRLAPEHPFPAGFQDCVDAYGWVLENCARWGGDAASIALAGDSAGGNLAAALAGQLYDGPRAPKATVLIYGAFDMNVLYHRKAKTDVEEALGRANRMNIAAYAAGDLELLKSDPRMSPLLVAERLPPCHIVVGEADPLVEQSDLLVERLRAAGVPHEYFIDPGMPHGFLNMEALPAARPAQARIFDFLNRRLG